MTEYNLNELENIVNTKFFTPIVLNETQQIEFTSVQSVREYAKGNGDLPVHTMMTRMLEAFFAHHSTCQISDLGGLATMFGKLYIGWCNRLYRKNKVLDPEEYAHFYEPVVLKRRMEFDQMYKQGNADVKAAVKAQRIAFNADHRLEGEVHDLVSKFCFKIASRFYVVPITKSRDIIKKYMKLRLKVIDEWYEHVYPSTMKTLWPDDWFTSLDPRTVAMKVFPQDVLMDQDDIDNRFEKFKKWHKKAGKEALKEARATNDPSYVQHVIHEWDTALLYAKSLHDGMQVYKEEDMDDFIVDDDDVSEYDSDVAARNDEYDAMEVDNDIKKKASKYEGKGGYADDATDQEIEAYLKKQDKKTKKLQRRFRNLEERAEEADSDEEDE